MSHLPVVNPAQNQTQGSGYVYFIQAGDAGPIKTRQRFVAIGNGQQCRNCGTLLTEADDAIMPTYELAGHCRACREFAAVRAAGTDPFD